MLCCVRRSLGLCLMPFAVLGRGVVAGCFFYPLLLSTVLLPIPHGADVHVLLANSLNTAICVQSNAPSLLCCSSFGRLVSFEGCAGVALKILS